MEHIPLSEGPTCSKEPVLAKVNRVGSNFVRPL